MNYTDNVNLNWENLMQLYSLVQQQDNRVKKTQHPIVSFFSDEVAWPNFSILHDRSSIENDILQDITSAIDKNQISPFLISSPILAQDRALDDSLLTYGIRQIDEWQMISHFFDLGIPPVSTNGQLRIYLVESDEQFAHWLSIVSNVLFRGRPMPENALRTSRFKLYLGVYKGTPVATTMLYKGDPYPSIHMVSVLPQYQRRGFGKLIFAHTIKEAYEMNYTTIYSQATTAGLKPWLEIGFNISAKIKIYWKIGKNR
jgi:GNAT superfamily N-acetyltransferase